MGLLMRNPFRQFSAVIAAILMASSAYAQQPDPFPGMKCAQVPNVSCVWGEADYTGTHDFSNATVLGLGVGGGGHGDGANCTAGNYPLGVDSNGIVQNCTPDANTNAQTLCADGLFLQGDALLTCVDVFTQAEAAAHIALPSAHHVKTVDTGPVANCVTPTHVQLQDGSCVDPATQAELDTHIALPNIHHTPTVNTDASTKCTGATVLDGTGACVDPATQAELDAHAIGNPSAHHVKTVNTTCLDGTVSCLFAGSGTEGGAATSADAVNAGGVAQLTDITALLKEGAGTKLATTSGLTSGECIQGSINGLVSTGAACGSGGGGAVNTVNGGTDITCTPNIGAVICSADATLARDTELSTECVTAACALNAATTLNGAAISTGAHTADTTCNGVACTLADDIIRLKDSASAPTTAQEIEYNSANSRLQVGTGGGTTEFYAGAHTATAPVTSVFGNTGAITAGIGDYTCSQVTNCTPSAITAAQVPANETDVAHDQCSEIAGCVVGAVTDTCNGVICTLSDDTIVLLDGSITPPITDGEIKFNTATEEVQVGNGLGGTNVFVSGPHIPDTTCLDWAVSCLFAASSAEGGAATTVATDAVGQITDIAAVLKDGTAAKLAVTAGLTSGECVQMGSTGLVSTGSVCGTGTGGEINIGNNLGVGTAIYAGKTGSVLDFKTLKQGSNVAITATATEVTVASTDTTCNGTVCTLADDTIRLKDSASAPTILRETEYDAATKRLQVGDGGVTTEFYPGAHTPVAPVDSVFGNTGAIIAQAGDYTCAQVTGCVAGAVTSNCDGVSCNLLDSSLVSCDTVDTDAFGNLVCGTDQDTIFVPAAGDYTASDITNVPAGGVASITVQAALNELDTEKLSSESDPAACTNAACTIGVNDTITADDNKFTVADNLDATKKLRIEVGSIATATTRVLTAPNYNMSLLDWGLAAQGTIHTDNYIEGGPGTDTTAFHASSDVDHNATTNFDPNKHIDHTAVTLTAGAGLGGGGDITASRSFSIASQEAGFLADGAAISLTCGVSNQGKAQVMDDGSIEYCDGATTSILRSGFLDADGIDDNTTYTGGNGITLSGTTLNFDGGAAPAGELGGTWASPTVDAGADSTAIHTNGSSEISSATLKATPVSADLILIQDSVDNTNKRITVGSLPGGGTEVNDLEADPPANILFREIFLGVSAGAGAFVQLNGDISVTDGTGLVAINANSVDLSTDTTGNYVKSVANGAGITGGSAGSHGAALTLSATLGTSIDAGEITAGAIDGNDINTNIAGRSLTLTAGAPDVLNVGAEVYTDVFSMSIEDPAITDDAKIQIVAPVALTITRIDCSTNVGTVTIQFDERTLTTPNTVGADVMASTLVCDGNNQQTITFSNAVIAAGAIINLDVDAVATAPSIVRINVRYTANDIP